MRAYIGRNHANNVIIIRVFPTVPNCYELARNWVRKQFNCCGEYDNAITSHISDLWPMDTNSLKLALIGTPTLRGWPLSGETQPLGMVVDSPGHTTLYSRWALVDVFGGFWYKISGVATERPE
jgi:hypothetical protein